MIPTLVFQFLKACAFRAVCEAAAQDYAIGLVDLIAAVDRLQDYAVGRGLVAEIGQDAVRAIMAAAFAPVRQREHDNFEPTASRKSPVAASTLDAAGYLIRQNDPKQLAAWLDRHTAQECAAIWKHFGGAYDRAVA